MINQVFVIDDVVSKSYQDLIENELLGQHCPWYYKKDISYNVADPRYHSKTDRAKTPTLGHMFFNIEGGGPITPGLHFMSLPIALQTFDKAGVDHGPLIKSRSFMHFPLAEVLRREHDTPHIDYDIGHLVCLYYVNESDGDTFIFDKKLSDHHPDSDFTNVEFNVIQRISPKKGRAVIFDGTIYHASSIPTKDVRCIINFNFMYPN
jgi:hypothetical protein